MLNRLKMSRPASMASGRLPVLPHIKHPLSDLTPGDQVGGINASRLGDLNGRPLATEERPFSRPRSNLFNRRHVIKAAAEKNPNAHHHITERKYTEAGAGQDCVDREVLSPYVGDRGYRDIKTPSSRPAAVNETGYYLLPIDSKPMVIPRDGNRQSSRSSTRADLRLEVDELEAVIREKCRNNQTEVQRRFRDNDAQGHGTITRDALLRVIVTLTARPVSHLLFQRLLVRFGIEDQTSFTYSDFIDRSNSMPGNPANYPKWITTMHQPYKDKSTMTSTQVHTVLKEKAKQRALNLFNLVPQANPDGTRRLLKPEFRSALAKQLQVNMTDEEFEKLWQRYDEQNVGVIDGTTLASKLGIFSDGRATPKPEDLTNCLKRKEEDRQRSLDVERWIKNKFRQGYHDMKTSFRQNISSHNGMIPAKEFCSILEKYGLRITLTHLDEFLARCGVVQTKHGVPYMKFLKMFSRSK
ncbi:hypothetical protein EB796_007792 [Bugula neritina]|uniref:Uncharacterized protein n=1 Tax=Bugula neritina TaxID=10212 RepID=A0A7J7K5J2_BUGNE|nr:hypothetical protein EB796_007792 [Bugula neritina]